MSVEQGIALALFIFLGFVIKIIFNKLNFQIKNPLSFSLILWFFGIIFVFSSINLEEKYGTSFLSNTLFIIGLVPLLIGAAIGFYAIFNPKSSKKL